MRAYGWLWLPDCVLVCGLKSRLVLSWASVLGYKLVLGLVWQLQGCPPTGSTNGSTCPGRQHATSGLHTLVSVPLGAFITWPAHVFAHKCQPPNHLQVLILGVCGDGGVSSGTDDHPSRANCNAACAV
mmetsp:Transcript_16587/g.29608  ORF Transcript_16587/g.29608 Transcript_16587/m.29608 type:complete len:128 (-) Transcript_16587:68-451(-)